MGPWAAPAPRTITDKGFKDDPFLPGGKDKIGGTTHEFLTRIFFSSGWARFLVRFLVA